MNATFRLGILSAALILSQQALAQDPVVTSSLTATRVDLVNGKTVLRPAAEAKPGDVLEYRATYANHGTESVAHLLATVPIPAGTTLLADTPMPAAALASTDAHTFAAVPLMHPVTKPNGTTQLEPVPLSDYRALRWDVGSLDPGKATAVSLHVRINPPVVSLADKP
jgi:uncharacterized repeat protein (TIGR01451 family)